MTNSEIKVWAKEKIKGKIWTILPAILVASIISNITIGAQYTYTAEEGFKSTAGVNFGWILYFVQVGLAYFMVKFITDQKTQFTDIFAYSKDFVRALVVNLLQGIFIALWSLLLIIPGIIKAFAYALIPMLLADEKYKDLGYMDVLKKSEEIMNGHKMDYFLLNLSFIGWYLLSVFTLGILLIWVIPYHETATTKFLYDLKSSYEKAHGQKPMVDNGSLDDKTKFCANCGTKIEDGMTACPNCGTEV